MLARRGREYVGVGCRWSPWLRLRFKGVVVNEVGGLEVVKIEGGQREVNKRCLPGTVLGFHLTISCAILTAAW